MFNLIDFSSYWKTDLIVRKDRPFSIEEFSRRQPRIVHGISLPLAAPEDVILTKLAWDKITPSERQRRDALNVAVLQWTRLDKHSFAGHRNSESWIGWKSCSARPRSSRRLPRRRSPD